ncbi:hypothetical protein U9M48_009605 [Paspalum notatum var. saurae]|uniref:Uncharacterized protein n=1 Tax=Paspalum notatum var. saurae TaxID=547442 RepID=A0AAQ3WFA6_PASNO
MILHFMKQALSFVRLTRFKEASDDSLSITSHRAEQLESLLSPILITETLEKNVVREDIGRAAKFRHSMKQYVHCFPRPLVSTESPEQVGKDDGVQPPSCLNDMANNSEGVVWFTLFKEAIDDYAIRSDVWWAAPSTISHRAEQLKSLLSPLLIAETLKKNVVGEDIGCAARLGHSTKHYVHCFPRPLASTESPEQVGEYDGIQPPSCLDDTSNNGEGEVKVRHVAAGAHDDPVGIYIRSHLVGARPSNAVEEGGGKRRATGTAH